MEALVIVIILIALFIGAVQLAKRQMRINRAKMIETSIRQDMKDAETVQKVAAKILHERGESR